MKKLKEKVITSAQSQSIKGGIVGGQEASAHEWPWQVG